VTRARRPKASPGERATALCFGASILAALGLAVVYIRGGQTQLEGLLLGVAIGGIGLGVVIWAKAFMPDEEVEEDRHAPPSSEDAFEALAADFEYAGGVIQRRHLLVRMATGAVAALGVALVFPIRSLGPRPGRDLKQTPYTDGVRLVREDGTPLRADDLNLESVVTAWPEGHTERGDSPTLVLRVDPELLDLPENRSDWAPEGILAYSKLCTHTGCPVGLYQTDEHLLLCPCHQSTFDVLRAAEPIFGPAARPLPQLPIRVNEAGELEATGDFSAPVGPGFWDRGRD
jgi:ubiquinol-cytochrome c reductase iron-sulfur subunit